MALVVAELSCNHLGKLPLAHDLIVAAKQSGADAVKFQTFTPDDLTLDSPDPRFTLTSGPWAGRRLYDLYVEAMTPWAWIPELFAHARELGMIAFATPGSVNAVAFLETHSCPMYKVASPEVGEMDLLRAIRNTGKPAIVSTGCATYADICSLQVGLGSPTFLHCVSAYPAPPASMNLHAMTRLPTPYGLSDHTTGILAAVCAVTLGAVMIEKHLMLPDTRPLDYGHSVTPNVFGQMVEAIRETEAMLKPAPQPEIEFRRHVVNGRSVRCRA
jgi:sialic acid synthase SpsE